MKTKIKTALLITLISLLCSCERPYVTNVGNGNIFIITNKSYTDTNNNSCEYTASVKGQYAGNNFRFNFFDNKNAFNVGDTVGFFKCTYPVDNK